MITAKNYAARAELELRKLANQLKLQGNQYTMDVLAAENIADMIKKAQHFVIPDGGKIFDDNLKGVIGSEIRLPFSSITVEYYMPPDDQLRSQTENLEISTKRIAVAYQQNRKQLEDICSYFKSYLNEPHPYEVSFKKFSDCENFIFISSIYNQYDELGNEGWAPSICTWLTPSYLSTQEEDGRLLMLGQPTIMFPALAELMGNSYGRQKAMEYFVRDLKDEINAIFELCEALSCSNVSYEPIKKIDPIKNEKRLKAGKLPIYETNTLTIKVPTNKKLSDNAPTGIPKNSPREHLRRGHIRRLDENRKIWVNSCVVNAGSKNGKIDKIYSVIK